MARRDQIIDELRREPEGLSVSQLSQAIGISRQALTRHLRVLLAEGSIKRSGRTRRARYVLDTWRSVADIELAPPFPAEDELYGNEVEPNLSDLSTNAADICRYALTEMLNNAIDHAQARRIAVSVDEDPSFVRGRVEDDGVGCFQKVMREYQLPSAADAIAHLSKGKQTTAPEAHSGEGIFFTSKVATRFELESAGLRWLVDNAREDMAVGDSERTRGTRVTFWVDRTTPTTLTEVFRRYTTEGRLAFERTHIHVRLFEHGETFISRSEAKRVLSGLEDFREIVLDYKGVRLVGQGFADEVYRVYQIANPNKTLVTINASEPVAFMIRRAGAKVEVR